MNPVGDQIERIEKFEVSKVETPLWNERGSELLVRNPAKVTGPAKAKRMMGEIAVENGLGTPRPTHLLTGLSKDKKKLYLMPVVNSEDPDALEITYRRSDFRVNLFKLFAALGRLVLEGTKEIYELHVTEDQIEIGGTTGRALYIELGPPKVESIRSGR